MDAYYFGCWGQPGHYIHGPGGRSVNRQARESLPWNESDCDGNLQPGSEVNDRERSWRRDGPQVQGPCRIHHREGWTAMAFWDRTGDRRSNSCSVVVVRGHLLFGDMLAAFREHFPEIHTRVTAEFPLTKET